MGQITAGPALGARHPPRLTIQGWGLLAQRVVSVRQIGFVETPSGRAAVALAATPASGSFDDGTAALTAAAGWLEAHTAELSPASARAVQIDRLPRHAEVLSK